MAPSALENPIEFRTAPECYKHWELTIDGSVATLALNIDETATLRPGYELKLNSYDLGVDIELYDATQRLRFEHPEVSVVVITSAKPRVFCAGANIKMLGLSSHGHKVNFCKFTNETRNGIEDATAFSGQTYICAVNGACAGGGYELALACDEIIMLDDGSTSVSLPETPLLAVLPGTGGLTRIVDKRGVRRDRADYFCMLEEGLKGQKALEWGLVDALVPSSKFEQEISERAALARATSTRPKNASDLRLGELKRDCLDDGLDYQHLKIRFDRNLGLATITITGPLEDIQHYDGPDRIDEGFWPLSFARQLDDAILFLRSNETTIGTWLFKSVGNPARLFSYDSFLDQHSDHWLVNEIQLYLKRVFKRLDVSSRSLLCAIEPGSCFVGTLFEIALASDQTFMLDGGFEDAPDSVAEIGLSALNFGPYPMVNGLTRLNSRFYSDADHAQSLVEYVGRLIKADVASELGLVTFIPDDIDWEDELRLVIEARASFSPDALTGMEASLRFVGPETMESKIFARLSAWQNWIFQRPNAVGERGALVLYGSGERPNYNKERI